MLIHDGPIFTFSPFCTGSLFVGIDCDGPGKRYSLSLSLVWEWKWEGVYMGSDMHAKGFHLNNQQEKILRSLVNSNISGSP